MSVCKTRVGNQQVIFGYVRIGYRSGKDKASYKIQLLSTEVKNLQIVIKINLSDKSCTISYERFFYEDDSWYALRSIDTKLINSEPFKVDLFSSKLKRILEKIREDNVEKIFYDTAKAVLEPKFINYCLALLYAKYYFTLCR